MLSPDRRDAWGRPVGIVQAKDGSLLIADDGGNKIWRVSYHGAKPTATPKIVAAPTPKIETALMSGSTPADGSRGVYLFFGFRVAGFCG